jgi:hypothetical protein
VSVVLAPSRKKEVDVRIVDDILVGRTCSDLEKKRFTLASVLEMVAVGASGGETRALARAQDLLAGIGDEDDFALENPDELVFGFVPVPLTRPGARWEMEKIHAELAQPCGVPETLTHAIAAGGVVG